ncbi:MAG: glycosyltransferase family 39 protein [Patescibacteria group bacterium]|nr:glycosyltransferase family 39 protein [Patescibacteria group bacterium]
MHKIFSVIKKYWPVILIVCLSLFLRLFRITSYMTFLGDEGRDALVWYRMLHGKLTLIGPMTSIGNMYLGPLFYYLMFPFYLVLGTTGPSIGTALFAGATTFFLWYFGKAWFSKKVGLIAAFLYAISPVAIVLSRSAWNPNIMPFFALLIIWGVWQFWQKEDYRWLAVEGVLLSFAIQSHYLGILLAPVVGLFFIVKLIDLVKSKNKDINKFLVSFALCALTFALLTALPLIWFDLRHNFINYQSFYKFFSERQTTVNLKPYKAIPEIVPLWWSLSSDLLAIKGSIAEKWIVCFSFVPLIGIFTVFLYQGFWLIKNGRWELHPFKKGEVLILTWLFIGFLGMGLYKQHIYSHYFGFLFPAFFLYLAWLLEKISRIKLIGKFLLGLSLVILIFFAFKESPLKSAPNQQMEHTSLVAQKIIEVSGGQPFNLGMIAKQNYDAGYRYFLEINHRKAIEIDAQKIKETVTDQLFVVCEEKECQPINHPQAEIANFGWSKIEQTWEFPWGVKLFKLGHYIK